MVCYYLIDSFSTGSELIPKDPFMRAKMRYFIKIYPIKIFRPFYSFIGFAKRSEE